ncbi:hypothetical protein CC78DRAFT_534684 [Lojkania enalia]|uniref:Uncharacterized protein n=1 Tax=Lojkania enalia TaxID=147567 RepID=A0A9P4KAU9_9PLEO|nr:hypothetical protein CC78DRAFT_534684 [Didymosphaeria enalia]
MPPPRFIRSPRPCHSHWSTLQVRWASDTRTDQVSTVHGDPKETSRTTKTKWWSSLFGKVLSPTPGHLAAVPKEGSQFPEEHKIASHDTPSPTKRASPIPSIKILQQAEDIKERQQYLETGSTTEPSSRQGASDSEVTFRTQDNGLSDDRLRISKHATYKGPPSLTDPQKMKALRGARTITKAGTVLKTRAHGSGDKGAKVGAPVRPAQLKVPDTVVTKRDKTASREVYRKRNMPKRESAQERDTVLVHKPRNARKLPNQSRKENLGSKETGKVEIAVQNQRSEIDFPDSNADIQTKLRHLLEEVRRLQEKLIAHSAGNQAISSGDPIPLSNAGTKLQKERQKGSEYIKARKARNSRRRYLKFEASNVEEFGPTLDPMISRILDIPNGCVINEDDGSGSIANGAVSQVTGIDKSHALSIQGKLNSTSQSTIGVEPTNTDAKTPKKSEREQSMLQAHDPAPIEARGKPDPSSIPMTDSKAVTTNLDSQPQSDHLSSRTQRKPDKTSELSQTISMLEFSGDKEDGTQRLVRNLHTQSKAMRSSDQFDQMLRFENDPISIQKNVEAGPETPAVNAPIENLRHSPTDKAKPANNPNANEARDENTMQSLLDELFPEASTYVQPHYPPHKTPKTYPRLELPTDIPVIRKHTSDTPKSHRQRIVESFQNRGEQITALQLLHCSTQLTESDFRRLIPKGKHIDSWVRGGEFHKIIPGRDPLSLERLPFYYLLFKSPESALAYQMNASRLHKLNTLHQPSSIFSAIPPPKGFLEDGEDMHAATSAYLLKPPTLKQNLVVVMQPYSASLTTLIENGGYKPIVPSVAEDGRSLYKVLLHIEGWEPTQEDLYHTFKRHAYGLGISWPFHRGIHGIRKLRELVDIPKKISSSTRELPPDASAEDSGEASVNQLVMNKVYNRWVIEFEEESAARRFAILWHRRVLPDVEVTWKVVEEVRMCNAEFLW